MKGNGFGSILAGACKIRDEIRGLVCLGIKHLARQDVIYIYRSNVGIGQEILLSVTYSICRLADCIISKVDDWPGDP